MVAKNDLVTAIQHIDGALRRFVGDAPNPRVWVIETPYGHVHAFVGSSRFSGLSLGARQNEVWRYLREHLEPQYLGWLYGVDALDEQEFDGIVREAEARAALPWNSRRVEGDHDGNGS